jgi:hypothetical protein
MAGLYLLRRGEDSRCHFEEPVPILCQLRMVIQDAIFKCGPPFMSTWMEFDRCTVNRVKMMEHICGAPEVSPNTCLNLLQVESDEARRHLYFHWSVNISGKPYLQRPLFQTNI